MIRNLWLSGILTAGILGAQAGVTNATISGTVKDSVNGRPLPNYTVSTTVNAQWVGNTIVMNKGSKDVSSTTDSSGRYRLEGLPPGAYRISTRNAQSFGTEMSRHVALNGTDLSDIDFLVKVEGSISGKVVDENKEPVPDVEVHLIAREYYLGNVGYYFGRSNARTNDLGEYTLSRVTPGRPYLLLVEKVDRNLPAHSEAPLNPELRRRIPGRTWWPNSPARDSAQALVLQPGEKREGVDIEVKKAPSLCIDGAAIGPMGPAAMRFGVEARQPSSGTYSNGGSFSAAPGGLTGADGKFRVCDLYPGTYRVSMAEGDRSSQSAPSYGSIDVSVSDRDIEGLKVAAGPGKPMEVEVAWEGDPPAAPPENKLSVSLVPLFRTTFAGERSNTTIAIPGTATIDNVFDDDYSVRLFINAPGIYVKDATYGGHSVLSEGLRAGSAMSGSGMRVAMAHDGGTITVQVNDKDGNPAADSKVLLMPADVASEGALAARLVQGQTNQIGQYTSSTLRPGKYYVVASDETVDSTPESITRLWRARTRFKEVVLPPSGTAQVKLEPGRIE